MRRPLLIPTIITFATAMGALPSSSQQASQHAVVAQTVYTTVITLEYDRPVARGRELFGALVEWDAIWTPGANRATWIDFSKPVTLEGHALQAGRYAIWMVPKEGEPLGDHCRPRLGTRITACSLSGKRSFGRWLGPRPDPTWRSWLTIFR